MAFFDKLSRTVTEAGQKTIAKTMELADITRLNSMISDEEKNINSQYTKIGKLYLSLHKNDYEDDFAEMVSTIAEAEDKIRNYYYMDGAKSDEEMIAEDEAHKVNEEDTQKRKPRRRSHDEVEAENKKKLDDYMKKREEAVDAIANGREEIPFDEAVAATDSIPVPELENVPRRTRAERKAVETPVEDPVQEESTPARRTRKIRS